MLFRSLIELPGLVVSILTTTVAGMSFVMRLIRTIGVLPIKSRTVSPIFLRAGVTPRL